MKKIFTNEPFFCISLGWLTAETCIRYIIRLLILCLFTTSTFSQVAPVSPPTGGFHIDGNLRANILTANVGDWFNGAGGSGGFVFNEGPFPIFSPINNGTTGSANDNYNSNDNVFTNGSKFNDYIEDLRWFTNSAPDKNDINNTLYHLSRNPVTNDQWIFTSGDRLSTNGTSYIDIELLQGSITENLNGTFTGIPNASKPNGGGRTENDIVISMEYTNGGTQPVVRIYQWKLANGKWFFKDIEEGLSEPEKLVLKGNAFAETNRSGAITNLPFESFGTPIYQQYAFVEAAVNISYLLSLSNQACQGINIKTLWVKTKASASSTAALKDYITPIPVDFTFGSASVNPVSAKCISDNNAYELSGTPAGGTFTGNGVSLAGGKYYFTPSSAGNGTHTMSYAFSGCNASTDITVNSLPTITPGTYGPACVDAGAITLLGTPSGGTWSGDGVSLFSGVYKFTPSSAGAGPHTLSYSYTDGNSCTNSGTTSVTVNALPATPGVSTIPPTCANANGTVTVTDPLGSDYEYSNNNGNYQASTSFTIASGAAYSIRARNKNTTCVSMATTGTMATQPATPSFTVCIVQPSLCSTGSLTVNATGGNGFSYSIDGSNFSNTTGVFSNLGAASVTSVQVKNSDGCASPTVLCANLVSQCSTPAVVKNRTSLNTIVQEELTIKAFPNPFTNKVRFVVSAPKAGKGTLEVYNMVGQKIATVFQGHVNAGANNFELILPGQQHGNLVYRFVMGSKKISGRLLQIAQ